MQEGQVKSSETIPQQGEITDYIKQMSRKRYTATRQGWVLPTPVGCNSSNPAREKNRKAGGTTTPISTIFEHARRPYTAQATHRPIEKYQTGHLQQKMVELERQLQHTRTKLRKAEEDRDYWINRMSKVTGEMLTPNNPDVVDLNDPKRPEKLAEQYGQLYDNERITAMKILTETRITKISERTGNDILISILQRSHEICIELADEQMKGLRNVVMLQPNMEKSSVKCPIEIQRHLQDAQTRASKRTLTAVQKKIRLQLKSLMDTFGEFPLDKLGSFVDKCTEICWSMVMQSPRVEFLIQ